MRTPKNFLILWRSNEASRGKGQTSTGTIGMHAKGLIPGDKVFIISHDNEELYLSGCMEIKKVDHNHIPPAAYGTSLEGKYQYIPLRQHKWELRFEHTPSARLRKNASLVWQVRSRRILSSESAILLLRLLRKQSLPAPQILRQFREEGGRLM